MRLLAVIPLTFTFIAFILTLVCIFAGNHPGYLEDTDLLTLNTSMLGQFTFNNTDDGKHHSGILGDIEGKLDDWEKDIKDDIQDFVNGAVGSLAQALDIHDFYSVHMLDYCEGYYEPYAKVNSTNEDPSKNVTHCSNVTSYFTFNPTEALQSELKHGINLTDLKWPDAVTDAANAVRITVKAMFVLYCIAAGLTGVGFFTAIVSVMSSGRVSVVINVMMGLISFLALLLASAISTAVARKIVSAVNKYGNKVGVEAYVGHKFIALTWVATVLMLMSAGLFGGMLRRSGGERRGKSAGGPIAAMSQTA